MMPYLRCSERQTDVGLAQCIENAQLAAHIDNAVPREAVRTAEGPPIACSLHEGQPICKPLTTSTIFLDGDAADHAAEGSRIACCQQHVSVHCNSFHLLRHRQPAYVRLR